MNMRSLKYFFSEASKSLYRNRLLTLVTIANVAICILILGAAVLMTVNANNIIDNLESDVEIVAFIDKEMSDKDTDLLREKIEKIDGVKAVVFISKEEGLKDLQEKLGGKEYDLNSTLEENPLRNSFEIEAVDPHKVPDIAKKIEILNGVYKVNYGKGVVEKLFQVTKWVRIVGIVTIVLLAFGAIFLISTTIRLAIFSRRKEVYLMKLIGASDWFVRMPFFLEGVFLGLTGAIIAVFFLALGYGSLTGQAHKILFLPLVTDIGFLINIYLILLGAGVLLGIFATYFSLSKFLDV
ncbi:MAG TPA: permease-like cell division protein FtsX [Syntrophomonadaceae bacterium]|nr:permease-like cell division protein FtsX [Syntrophomonadaceae bacterium]HPR93864.1 permease-like cell division protein FtsX [Syntrophomonadaceae bacterium]